MTDQAFVNGALLTIAVLHTALIATLIIQIQHKSETTMKLDVETFANRMRLIVFLSILFLLGMLIVATVKNPGMWDVLS